ncbi:response regulator transcription factor [Micromonospora sp. KC213]|nr:response regulator transcription factor [Micromonospora sp. KC213]
MQTTFDLDEYVFAALRAGASGFLLKNAPPGDLRRAVRVVAAGHARLGPAVTRRVIKRHAHPAAGVCGLDTLTPLRTRDRRPGRRGLTSEEIGARRVVASGR